MKDILAKQSLRTLADFACSNVLIGFDYDGTLAATVSRPRAAGMRATTRRLLKRVAHLYPCIIISGRAHGDLVKRVGQLPLRHIIGNHGLEPWAETEAVAAQVKRWVHHLRVHLEALSGVVVEDKKYSATVHYRHARDRARARRKIAAVVRSLPNARILDGDMALNLILRTGPDKGVALQRARRALACDTAIYVGNDGTDEDAFASAPANRLLGVRIGRSRSSRAGYYLRSQGEIDPFLQILLAMRTQ